MGCHPPAPPTTAQLVSVWHLHSPSAAAPLQLLTATRQARQRSRPCPCRPECPRSQSSGFPLPLLFYSSSVRATAKKAMSRSSSTEIVQSAGTTAPTPRLRTTMQRAAVNPATVRYGTILTGDTAAYPSSLFTALPATSDEGGSGLSAGAIAGIAVGAVAGVLLVAFLAFLFIVRSRRSRRQEHDGTEKKNKRGSAQNLLPTSNSTSSGSSFASGRQVPAMQNVPNYKTASSGAASTPATVTPVTPTMTNWARPEPASNMGAAPTPPKATQAKNGLFFGGLGAGRNARHPTKHKHRLSTTSSTAPILQDGTRLSGDSSRPRYSTDTMASLPSVRAPNMQPNDRFGYAYSGTPEVSSQGRFSSDLPPVAEP